MRTRRSPFLKSLEKDIAIVRNTKSSVNPITIVHEKIRGIILLNGQLANYIWSENSYTEHTTTNVKINDIYPNIVKGDKVVQLDELPDTIDTLLQKLKDHENALEIMYVQKHSNNQRLWCVETTMLTR